MILARSWPGILDEMSLRRVLVIALLLALIDLSEEGVRDFTPPPGV
jgi:hypothetical protein